MKFTVSTLLLTLLTVSARPLASQAEQHSSISGTPCSLVNCKSACFLGSETCDALCQGDKDLPLCAIGTSPPPTTRIPILPGLHQNHTIPNQCKDVARVLPPPRLSMPTPYCSLFQCDNICDPLWRNFPEEGGAEMPNLCARWCNNNQYIPMCPEGIVPVYKDA